MSAAPGSIPWFAAHEFRLAWRDGFAMMTGGKRRRAIGFVVVLAVLTVVFHLMANALVADWAASGITDNRHTLVFITGGGFLFWTVMLSQALESVTRAYYARSDLDLIFSSPASSRKLFAVRTGATAVLTLLLSLLIASPIINMLVVYDGPQWLAAYGVLAALSALSTTIAVLVTIGLFKAIGPKRTRLIAQVIAGIVGAGFVIGIQAAAIFAYGSMSRFSLLTSDAFVASMPDETSPLWLPARAAMGNWPALLIVMLVGFGALAATLTYASSSFGRLAIAAGSISKTHIRQGAARPFRPASQAQALRRKEWKLLARDPWLLSQTLMQILYLVPPALLLWVNFGAEAGAFIVVVPVLVMASGQLAGGLAWLAISGEDAHDLVVTAPLPPRLVLRARIEAVVIVLAIILTPIAVLIALSSPAMAAITLGCAALAAASATAIQLWFRVPMRRAMFRRRQVASRVATISEAFVSIMWAGVAALLAGGGWIAIMAALPALIAIGVLGIAWILSPKGKPV
jgi:ABC-2 type transport system permease protein